LKELELAADLLGEGLKSLEGVADSSEIDFKGFEVDFGSVANGARSLEVRRKRVESLYG
jgi:hypothetical protein